MGQESPVEVEDMFTFYALSTAIFFGTVLVLFKALTFLLLNDGGIFEDPIHNIDMAVPKAVEMSKVNVPFTFKLHDKTLSSYAGVHCIVSSDICYRLEAYWGVSVADLHFFLRQPWDFNSSTSLKQTPLKGHYQQVTDVLRVESHQTKEVKLELTNNNLMLGAPPRQYYPLVVFLLRDSPQKTLQPDEAVALVNIVHIKDNECTLSSSLLAQYLKQANGRLTTLKQLYVASASINDSDDNVIRKEGTEQLCIVCQVHPISRALLPCRHTCICAVCFYKIYACPLCRSPIKTYFLIKSEDYYKESNKVSYNSSTESFTQWFHDEITDFLGFDRG